jgi:hypothetical protein
VNLARKKREREEAESLQRKASEQAHSLQDIVENFCF